MSVEVYSVLTECCHVYAVVLLREAEARRMALATGTCSTPANEKIDEIVTTSASVRRPTVVTPGSRLRLRRQLSTTAVVSR